MAAKVVSTVAASVVDMRVTSPITFAKSAALEAIGDTPRKVARRATSIALVLLSASRVWLSRKTSGLRCTHDPSLVSHTCGTD